MDLYQLKETINKAGFSEEGLRVINEILDKAIERGFITEEEKSKLLAVIDIEIEAADIEAEAIEKIAELLEAYAKDVDKIIGETEKEIEEIDKETLSNLQKIVEKTGLPAE